MPTDDAAPVCIDCRYWEPPVEDAFGECRRRAPTILQGIPREEGQAWVTAWPATCSGDWCGEFRPCARPPRVDE